MGVTDLLSKKDKKKEGIIRQNQKKRDGEVCKQGGATTLPKQVTKKD